MTPLSRPLQGWRRPTRRELLATVLVGAGLTVFVVLVYVAAVLGGGALLGRTSAPSLGLSVLATATVAVAFDPVQRRLERWASGVVLAGRPSPYDVVRRFTTTLAARSPDRADQLLAEQEGAADDAINTLVRLSRGIFPPRLEASGVAEALRSAIGGDRSVQLHATGVGRYPGPIEATAYFCCLEAIQNAVKHAQAATTRVDLVGTAGALELTVSDDGRGFEPGAGKDGAGLTNMRERVESVGGELSVSSAPGAGTRIRVVLPASVGSVA
jgi:hypothetical protein